MRKVQGRLLPSRTIRQGVDMGRSFSVYLFCFAMDPLFHYLNRIPGVISVQAYVDDTTIAGVARDPTWLHEVAEVYRRVSTWLALPLPPGPWYRGAGLVLYSCNMLQYKRPK